MNNLISIFMNDKINHFIEYGIYLYGEDSPFLRKVLKAYFSLYVDNYYYETFHTLENATCNPETMELEFKGLMEELLEEHRQYELVESNEEYNQHVKQIKELKDFSLEVIAIDFVPISQKEKVSEVITEWIEKNGFYQKQIGKRLPGFLKLVREYYQNYFKLLQYQDHYFSVFTRPFENNKEMIYMELEPHVNALNPYRKSMVNQVYQKEELNRKKIECLLQKVSLLILKNVLEKETNFQWIIELPTDFIKRGKIDDEIYALIDNPLFRKHVVLGVNYNTYLNQKEAFEEDFHFACIQDFSHINDLLQKIDSIEKEGIFHYLVVSNCKYKDREYFLTQEPQATKILVFEEE